MKKYLDQWIDAKTIAPTGDLAVILNEGEDRTTKFGSKEVTRPVFLISHNKEEKKMTMNKRSIRELIKEYGDDSKGWIGKVVLLIPVNVQVGNEVKLSIHAKPHLGTTPPNIPPSVTVERVV